jgi:hypothetical protein
MTPLILDPDIFWTLIVISKDRLLSVAFLKSWVNRMRPSDVMRVTVQLVALLQVHEAVPKPTSTDLVLTRAGAPVLHNT